MHPKDPHFINKMSGKRKYLGNSLPREVCHYLATLVYFCHYCPDQTVYVKKKKKKPSVLAQLHLMGTGYK